MKYDFRLLSPYDFQLLVRDLLKAHRNEEYESFASGPDGGVDLRQRSPKGNVVVQCKHYVGAGFHKLKSTMENEVKQWDEEHQRLNFVFPMASYVLATSVPLTPNRKATLEAVLKRAASAEVEVVGQEDLNQIITAHPEVEQRHPSLWLTSVPVLKRILYSSFFGQSEIMRERAKRRLQVYVMNPSFSKAKDMLETKRVCVLAGEQGVGKTCLAEVLVSTYIEQGFEAYEITGDVSEIYKALDTKRPQIFLYDDFLGMTAFEEKLNKNEEGRLISLIEAVKNGRNSRLILTTREYILRQARRTYEKLDRAQLDLLKFVVEVAHLDRRAKAEILYRHLCFSTLPRFAVQDLICSRAYLKIIDHANYNPRLIETMCEGNRHPELGAKEFPNRFLASLENPLAVWEHPFERHLDRTSRDLVLSACTFMGWVLLSALVSSVKAFSGGKHDISVDRHDVKRIEDAIKIIEGTFLSLSATQTEPVLRLIKPSLRDFCEGWFDLRDPECESMLLSAVRFEQVEWAIQQCTASNRSGFRRAVERNPSALCDAAIRTLHAPRSTAWDFPGGIAQLHRKSSAERLKTFLSATRLLPLKDEFHACCVQMLRSLFENGYPSDSFLSDLLEVFDMAITVEARFSEEITCLMQANLVSIINEIIDVDEADSLVDICDRLQISLSKESLDLLREKFIEVTHDMSCESSRFSGSNEWEAALAGVQRTAKKISADIQRSVERVLERIEELREEEENPSPRSLMSTKSFTKSNAESVTDEELALMFSTL